MTRSTSTPTRTASARPSAPTCARASARCRSSPCSSASRPARPSACARCCAAARSTPPRSKTFAGWCWRPRGWSTRVPALRPSPERPRLIWRSSRPPRSARRSPWSRNSSWIATGERRDAPRRRVAGIVTLTTDFGLRDAYVAEMKGVMLGIAHAARQDLQFVDVTHDIERHDITEGALALEAMAPYFPAGTVHLAVVDPGVGTSRRGMAVMAGEQIFVGPDNGLFSPFLHGEGWRAFDLEAPDYRLRVVSRTFHGRDVFAPAAAHLAMGTDVARLGPPISDPVMLAWPEVREVTGSVAGA